MRASDQRETVKIALDTLRANKMRSRVSAAICWLRSLIATLPAGEMWTPRILTMPAWHKLLLAPAPLSSTADQGLFNEAFVMAFDVIPAPEPSVFAFFSCGTLGFIFLSRNRSRWPSKTFFLRRGN